MLVNEKERKTILEKLGNKTEASSIEDLIIEIDRGFNNNDYTKITFFETRKFNSLSLCESESIYNMLLTFRGQFHRNANVQQSVKC